MVLETVSGRTVFNGGRDGIQCCRRAVAEGAPMMVGVLGGDRRVGDSLYMHESLLSNSL